LRETFDAKQLRRLDGEGKVRHAEVRIGDTVGMLAEALPEWPATPVNLHVYVPAVDAVYARALAAGAAPVQEPVRKGDVDKRGGFRDPVGNTWWVATQQEVDPTVLQHERARPNARTCNAAVRELSRAIGVA